MYALYAIGLLAGILLYFIIKYMDEQDHKTYQKVRKS